MSHSQSNTTSPYADYGTNSDHGQGPPRKKMRKGTKSCLECRRRKIKCTFEDGRPSICNECYARGSTCIDQEHGDIQSYPQTNAEPSSYSLRERVTQLEDLVKQVLNRLPENGTTDGSNGETDRSQLDAQAAEVLKSLKTTVTGTNLHSEESILLPGGIRGDAPVLTLFDNAVITRKDSQPAISRAQYNKSKTLIAALNKLLPSPHDLEIILESSHEWWTIWRKMFPEITDRRCETMKESVSHSLRSEKPAEIAKIMLCIAISIHQMPDGFDWNRLHLKESRSQLMEKYINTVDHLIVADDEIAATVDGIECMVLEAKYHTNMGRPRRAWLLFNRAIAFCQLLGFHRLPNRPDKSSNEFRRQENIWNTLVAGDRYLSLILGLPYTVPANFYHPSPPTVNSTDTEVFLHQALPIITKIVDRNQSVVPMGYSATLRLDQDLEELHNSQDPAWWTTDLIPGQAVEDHFDRLQAQFFYHQAKVLLHMPFMLRSSATDKRYQYSHSSALEAARGMIQYYVALRTNQQVGPYICKLIDFQGFTAAMLLLLNLCGYSAQHRGGVSQLPDLEQDQRDSELIDRIISLLHDAAHEVGGVVAAQSAKALEMLAQVRQGIDCREEQQCNGETCQVSIPYFGTITIGMGKQFVPIKPGTYPKPGEPRSMKGAAAAAVVPNSGLPTPPSITSGSTQHSPLSTTLDHHGNPISTFSHPQAKRPPIYESTEYIAPGLGSDWPADDPFVTFDSFMALPPQNFDFPTVGSNGSGSSFTPQTYGSQNNTPSNDQMLGGNGNMAMGMGMGGSGGFTFSGFPFGADGQAASNVDLDQGWNWFGVDAPIMQ